MERAYFIPETMTTGNALQEMRKRRGHMAIVVDEYGGTSGLVTFEDILEEVLFCEICPHEMETPLPRKTVIAISRSLTQFRWLVKSTMRTMTKSIL